MSNLAVLSRRNGGGLSQFVGEILKSWPQALVKMPGPKEPGAILEVMFCFIRKFKIRQGLTEMPSHLGVYQVWVDHVEVGWF